MPFVQQDSGIADAVSATNANANISTEAGIVTTPALTSAAGATFTQTVYNHLITPLSVVVASVTNGTNTKGDPTVSTITVSDSKIVITVANRHASQALNGTLKISFISVNPTG